MRRCPASATGKTSSAPRSCGTSTSEDRTSSAWSRDANASISIASTTIFRQTPGASTNRRASTMRRSMPNPMPCTTRSSSLAPSPRTPSTTRRCWPPRARCRCRCSPSAARSPSGRRWPMMCVSLPATSRSGSFPLRATGSWRKTRRRRSSSSAHFWPRDRSGRSCPPPVRSLPLQHRPPLVAHEEVVHVVGVLLFNDEDPLEHDTRARIVVAEVANQLAVMVDRDPFCDQILLDHVDQILALAILAGGAHRQSFRVEVGPAAELIDALGDRIHVFLLFLGVLSKLVFDAFARDAGRGNRVHGVAQYADDLGREHALQQFDGLADIARVGRRDRSLAQVLSGALTQGLHVSEEGCLGVAHVVCSLRWRLQSRASG